VSAGAPLPMPAEGSPEVAVVVSTYRRPELLPRLVGALEAQTLDPARFEVVLVDNGSGDATASVLDELAARSPLRLRVLHVAENHGPAPARNLGWQATQASYVAFTDDDCVPRPDWLAQALAAARATPDLGVLQGATLRPPAAHAYGPRTVFRETLAPSPYFEGCNLLFPRAVLERTGGFDESYHFGGEDTAAGWAAIEAGGRWLFDETTVVVHDVVERPLRWHLMMAWREGNLVDVAARHPAFRRQGLWRRWAHRPWNVAYAVGVASTVAALGWRQPVALAGWLPWLWLRRPPVWPPHHAARTVAWWLVHDGVVVAGMVRGSVRNRTLVL
jgi:glycosyltransferase involved in cell wall biosynthesis